MNAKAIFTIALASLVVEGVLTVHQAQWQLKNADDRLTGRIMDDITLYEMIDLLSPAFPMAHLTEDKGESNGSKEEHYA